MKTNTLTEFYGKDRYIIHDELWRSPTYTTYLVTAAQSGQRFMVKVLETKPEKLESWLVQEAKALSGLQSPRIVRLHDHGVTVRDQVFLVMEDVQGRLLTEWIVGREPVDEFTALCFLQQLALALKELSALRIVHRAIDPTSIFVCASPNWQEEILVKLWDFGLARTRQLPHETETMAGFQRLGFLAPEQVMRQAVDQRTDIYGIGAVVYWLLTGKAPYEAEGLGPLVTRISGADSAPLPLAELRPDLSQEAVRVINGCLAHAPARRFASPEQLLQALQIRTDPLDYLYEQACRAQGRSAWSDVLALADQAQTLTGARVRFRDLVRHAEKMLEEAAKEAIEIHSQNATEWLARQQLADAQEAVNQLAQLGRQYPELATKMALPTQLDKLRSQLATARQFKPAYLESYCAESAATPADAQPPIGQRYELLRPRLRLGRRSKEQSVGPELDLIDLSCEARGKTVSRTHAHLAFEDGAWRLRVAPTVSNSVYLNEEALAPHQEQALTHQDLIRLGKVTLRFYLLEDPYTFAMPVAEGAEL